MTSGSRETDTFAESWRSLTPSGAPDAILAAATVDSEVVRALSARTGPGPLLWALEESERFLRRIEVAYSDMPDLPSREIKAAVEAWFITSLTMLAGQQGSDTYFVQAMSELGREATGGVVPFKRIIRDIRHTQSECLMTFLHARPDRELDAEEYVRTVTAVSRVTDDGIAQFTLDYLDEHSKLVDSEAMRRRELIERLLSGGSTTPAAEIASGFGFDIEHVHTAFVIDHQAQSASAERASLVRKVRARLGAATLLLHPESPTRTVFWVTGASALAPVLKELRAFSEAVRVMGEPSRGLQGFRTTYAQANDLAVVAAQLPRTAEVMRWSDHALTVTLGFDLERSVRFVRSVLGPLSESTRKAAEQRETLQAYLSSDKSLLHAAEERKVHRNTIAYRLRRIEDLIGRPLRGDVLDLQCALHLVERLGEEVLGPLSSGGPGA
ncbi:PucR family transcriptional regulator [Streptomyces justiciae]|uniref:PucR family transcriptional regulator n=1 Tax=Streptomyces justiciae TaxID=2780140 RepID=UPI002118F1FC|nr:helix-turn-helix domain-containing protein [Streptomyces justiciae]MCW8379728.1 helix-turn-helix domain-containing protein [Streptomyces justiciae]